jgi:hypothetical protein
MITNQAVKITWPIYVLCMLGEHYEVLYLP